jgi:toxin ParE1/3/4
VTLPLFLRPEAEADLVSSRNWYGRLREGLGDDFVAAIAEQFERIVQSPEQYALCFREIRRAKPRRFPYIIYFRMLDDRIEILGVLHASRDPRVWHRRAE